MPKHPETSTSRLALEAAANLLALVESSDLPVDESLDRARGVIHNIKGLRDYQLDELLDFLHLRLTGAPFAFTPDQYDPDVDDDRQERHRAAVDDLIAAGQTTIDDIDPREAAEELAARVRGTVTPPEGGDDA